MDDEIYEATKDMTVREAKLLLEAGVAWIERHEGVGASMSMSVTITEVDAKADKKADAKEELYEEGEGAWGVQEQLPKKEGLKKKGGGLNQVQGGWTRCRADVASVATAAPVNDMHKNMMVFNSSCNANLGKYMNDKYAVIEHSSTASLVSKPPSSPSSSTSTSRTASSSSSSSVVVDHPVVAATSDPAVETNDIQNDEKKETIHIDTEETKYETALKAELFRRCIFEGWKQLPKKESCQHCQLRLIATKKKGGRKKGINRKGVCIRCDEGFGRDTDKSKSKRSSAKSASHGVVRSQEQEQEQEREEVAPVVRRGNPSNERRMEILEDVF